MDQKHANIPIPLPTAGDLREQAEMGERVSLLMEQQGWSDLLAGIARYRDTRVLTFPMCKEGTPYVEFVGEQKGLANIERIAATLVQHGENAATKLRAAESGDA